MSTGLDQTPAGTPAAACRLSSIVLEIMRLHGGGGGSSRLIPCATWGLRLLPSGCENTSAQRLWMSSSTPVKGRLHPQSGTGLRPLDQAVGRSAELGHREVSLEYPCPHPQMPPTSLSCSSRRTGAATSCRTIFKAWAKAVLCRLSLQASGSGILQRTLPRGCRQSVLRRTQLSRGQLKANSTRDRP